MGLADTPSGPVQGHCWLTQGCKKLRRQLLESLVVGAGPISGIKLTGLLYFVLVPYGQ